MSSEIHANLGAIQNMETASERFSHFVTERLPDIERELSRVSELLDERRNDLRREIASLQAEISSAEEDEDTTWASSRIDEVEAEIAEVERRIQRLATVGASVTGQVSKINQLATDHAVKTREFLRGTAGDLNVYFGKKADFIAPGIAMAVVLTSSNLTKTQLAAVRTQDIFPARRLLEKIDQMPGSYRYWQQVGLAKELPELGNEIREGNIPFRKALFHLASAQKSGLSSAEIADEIYRDSQMPQPIIEIRKKRAIGNLKEIRGLGLDTAENLNLLKRGESPYVTRGIYAGSKVEVDHMVSIRDSIAFKNEVANFQLLPEPINRKKTGSSVSGLQAQLEAAYNAAYRVEKRDV